MIIPTKKEATTINICTVGIDLAKNVFQIHCVDERGNKLFNKQLQRKQVMKFFAKLPLCLIGMEAIFCKACSINTVSVLDITAGCPLQKRPPT